MSANPPGDNPNLQRAFTLANKDEARNFYDEWASGYDKDVAAEAYTAPDLAADALVHTLRGRGEDGKQLEGLKILDAGCGTGLVGVSLARFGALTIDGLDISPGMLKIARNTGVYAALEEADLTERIARQDNSYDAALCVGTFTQGHVGPQPIKEFVRVVKPRGVIVATVLDAIWESDGFKAEVDRLQASGAVKVLGQTMIVLRDSTKSKGRLLVMEKQ